MAHETIERLLFIGFGKISGYYSFNWSDEKWLNAADYKMVFINCKTLDELFTHLRKGLNANGEVKKEAVEAYRTLSSNMSKLNQELIKIAFTQRTTFALLTGPNRLSVSQYSSLTNQDWLPYTINVAEHNGETTVLNDNKFEVYSTLLTKWEFSISAEAGGAEHWKNYRGEAVPKFSNSDRYVVAARRVVSNLSEEALGLAIQCNVFDYHAKLVKQTTPMYLLHHPQTGTTQEVLNSLLTSFSSQRLYENDVPAWVSTYVPPAVSAIDEELTSTRSRLREIESHIKELNDERKSFEKWRKLLYATDIELEDIVLEALHLLGLENAVAGPKSEWDINFELNGLNVVVEVKGLTRGLGRKHVFDLDRHVSEYETKTGNKGARGVLVFNPFRNEHPDNRPVRDCVAGDAIKFATDLNITLVSTTTIYELIRDRLEGRVNHLANELKQIVVTNGLYVKFT